MPPVNPGTEDIAQLYMAGRRDLYALRLLRFRFELRSRGIAWTQFKGFPFHGALGNALRSLDPAAYQVLYNAGGIGAPFVLTPPWDKQNHYPSDHHFLCDITLFGQTVSYMPVCCDAMREVGRSGIDKFRGKFDVEGVLNVTPGGCVPASATDKPCSVGANEIAAALSDIKAQYVSVRFVTPVRIKKDNVLLRRTPSFGELMEALLGRVRILGGAIGWQEREQILTAAQQVIRLSSDVAWYDQGFERYSARQHSIMKFGGLLGESLFQGNLAPFLPYLAQLEYLNLGGKTTFGLGKCLLAWPNGKFSIQ